MKIAFAFAAAAALALAIPAFAQDQKAPDQTPQAEQGMKGMMKGGAMDSDMMARMNKMMDRCEKMMGEGGMHKGMRHHKKS